MPKEKLTMRNIREILRLYWECKLSQRQVATSCGVSSSTVGEYIMRARTANISWPISESITDLELESLLFSPKKGAPKKPAPEFLQIVESLN